MSCTSPRTVAITMVPLPEASDFSMCGSSRATAVFITSADCSTNGSCISPAPKRSPTTFMPSSRWSLMMPSGVMPSLRARSRSSSRPLPSPSMMRRSRRSPVGSAASSAARWSLSAAVSTPANRSSMLASGSYVRLPSASYSRRSQTRSRATLRCSSGSEASGTILAASMMPLVRPACTASCRNTEFRTDARCRVQAEGHVGDAEGGVDAGVLRGDLADGLDRFDGVPAGFFLAGGDGEGQGSRR